MNTRYFKYDCFAHFKTPVLCEFRKNRQKYSTLTFIISVERYISFGWLWFHRLHIFLVFFIRIYDYAVASHNWVGHTRISNHQKKCRMCVKSSASYKLPQPRKKNKYKNFRSVCFGIYYARSPCASCQLIRYYVNLYEICIKKNEIKRNHMLKHRAKNVNISKCK